MSVTGSPIALYAFDKVVVFSISHLFLNRARIGDSFCVGNSTPLLLVISSFVMVMSWEKRYCLSLYVMVARPHRKMQIPTEQGGACSTVIWSYHSDIISTRCNKSQDYFVAARSMRTSFNFFLSREDILSSFSQETTLLLWVLRSLVTERRKVQPLLVLYSTV